jgi:cryptochrome
MPAVLNTLHCISFHALPRLRAVYPVFVLDPHFANPDSCGPLRYAFLLETLTNLDANLKAAGSRLYVVRGTPTEVLPRLFK